jgi:putative transposase
MLDSITNCCFWLLGKLNIIGNLAAENIALRQQLIVLKRNQKRPTLKEGDRLFWVLLSRIWSGWRDAIYIVQPDTVVRWHKRAVKLYWRRKSERGKRGRPSTDPELRSIVLKMAEENPLWGAPTIHGELLKLGFNISERTVSKIIRKRTPKPPSQTWRTFIKNHMTEMVAIDFFVVPTIRFRMLYVFIVLSHARRRVVHFNVTANPTAAWTAQQIVEAFPWGTAPRYLLRDRDRASMLNGSAGAFNQWVLKKLSRHTTALGKIPTSNGFTEVFAASAPIISLSLAKTIYAKSSSPTSNTITKTENTWGSTKTHRWGAPFPNGHRHLQN